LAISYAQTDCDTAITSLYQTVLCRNPDANGLNFWVNECENGRSVESIGQSIRNDHEYQNCAICQNGCNGATRQPVDTTRDSSNPYGFKCPAGTRLTIAALGWCYCNNGVLARRWQPWDDSFCHTTTTRRPYYSSGPSYSFEDSESSDGSSAGRTVLVIFGFILILGLGCCCKYHFYKGTIDALAGENVTEETKQNNAMMLTICC